MIGPLGAPGERPLPHSLAKDADDGLPDADLERALYAWATGTGDTTGQQRAVIEAFRKARVYVPAVAPESGRLGMIALRREDGMTALAVFTGIERLVAWRPDARPLPHVGSILASMAADDGHTMCVVDLDGPITATLPVAALLGD
ncbi:SseB family protein [Blastococcus sp. Marseille-P5729]|uniref:SseB family protein n=1 Tax=Blastococcus sp. Marseille-P5729 TaxID=2086582 RepID=UPI00131C1D39|nr:SseB family protein [Blastococcus sp. Marseille-P5729]